MDAATQIALQNTALIAIQEQARRLRALLPPEVQDANPELLIEFHEAFHLVNAAVGSSASDRNVESRIAGWRVGMLEGAKKADSLLCSEVAAEIRAEVERRSPGRSVSVRIGDGALTRDLVWCDCGRGISVHGKWGFCPRCGGPIDQESYEAAVREATRHGSKIYRSIDDDLLLKRIDAAESRLTRIHTLVTRALAEPPDGTETLVEIATICEEQT